MVMATFPVALLRSWKTWTSKERSLILNLLLPAVVGALIACQTSRQTLYNAYITAFWGALAICVLTVRTSRAAGWILAFGLLVYTCHWRWVTVYEDDTSSLLTYEMKEGPFKFLRTTPAKGELLNSVYNDIKRLPTGHSILYKDHFPAGFLMSDLTLLGPTTNILPYRLHPEARPLYVEIYRQHRYHPDFVLEFRSFPFAIGQEMPYLDTRAQADPFFDNDPFHNFFMRTGEYKVVLDRNYYRILKRTTPF
jgi:hypothetical protein